MRRLLAIEVRHSAMLPMLPVLAGLLLLSPIARHLTPVALWTSRSNDVQSTVQAIGPFVAGTAAWMAYRERRRAVSDLLVCTPYPPLARRLATWAAVAVWAALCYLVNVGVVFAITAGQATWGRPVLWPVLSGLTSVVACTMLGFVAGKALPGRLTAPLVAIGTLVAMAAMMEWALGGEWLGRLSPIYPSIGESPFYRVDPSLSQAQVLCYLGVAAAAVGLLALAGRRDTRAARLRGGALAAAGLVLAAAGTGLALRSPVGDFGHFDRSARPASAPVPVAYTPVCAGSPLPICVHPAFRRELAALEAALSPVTAPLAGTPAMPSGVAQSRHDGSLLPFEFGDYQLRGDTIVPYQALTILRTRFALALVTAPGTGPAKAGAAQRAVAAFLLRQAGVTPEPGLLPPSTVDTSAAQRLAALDASGRHAWFAAHATALRAGTLTLADLP